MELCHNRARGLVMGPALAPASNILPKPMSFWGLPRGLVVWLLGLTLVRLVAAAVIPYTEDEAYYRLWAQHLALGYYDHPPMMAWWIAIGQGLVGDTPFGARLLAVLASGLTSLLIYRIGALAGLSERASSRAALWYNFTFLVAFGGYLIVPDAPASFFWVLTLYAVLRATAEGFDQGKIWWLTAGATAGLALLSKYSALFFAPGLGIWLFTSQTGRKQLLRPGPWLAALVALSLFGLNIYWNLQHGLVSFEKQFGRVAAETWTPLRFVDFALGQWVLINPLVAVLAAMGLIPALKRLRTPLDPLALVAVIGAPFFLYLAVHSLHAQVQGHWPAPLYPSFAILAAASLDQKTVARKPLQSLIAKGIMPLGLLVALLAPLHMAIPATDIFGRYDMSAQIRGWPRFAHQVEMIRRQTGAAWIGTTNFGEAALLSAQSDAGGRAIGAPILQVNERDRYAFQPPPDPVALAHPGLMVDLDRRLSLGDLSYCFGSVRKLADVERGDAEPSWRLSLGGAPLSLALRRFHYAVYLVDHPRFDLVKTGCWEAKNLADSLKLRQRRLRLSTP